MILTAIGDQNERPYDDYSYPDHEKEEITFSRWALNEMLGLIWDHPQNLASEIVEDFAFRCLMYKKISELPDQKRIFTIAADTALEILEEIKEVEK